MEAALNTEAKGFRAAELAPTILIVDDEASIRRTLQGVFQDEGYYTLVAEGGQVALQILDSIKPDLVVLDIWMPGIDGIETLKRIKELYSDLPVIMISGHATISTAITATKIGAADFIEKPLDLNSLLLSAKKVLGLAAEQNGNQTPAVFSGAEHEIVSLDYAKGGVSINPVVFPAQLRPGRKLIQKSLARSAVLYGQGLHSGKKSGLIVEPLPANSGIHFVGVDQVAAVPAYVDFVESTGYATTLKLGDTQAGTIEHLMSALHAYGISNLLVKCNGEVPVMDGSALEFCSLIEEIGIEEQEGDWYGIHIAEPITFNKGKEFIKVEPSDRFIIDYTLDYPAPIGRQHCVFELGDVESFKRDIAPARTFGFVKDIGWLQKQGLALGGRLDNFVLIGEQGIVNGELRFPDEMVRHKILDEIGDLYLLGRPIQGKITAQMTGHSDNIALIKLIAQSLRGA